MKRHGLDGVGVVGTSKFPTAGSSERYFPISVVKAMKPETRRALSRLAIPVRYTRTRKLTILARADIPGMKLGRGLRLSARAPCVSGVGDLYFYGALEYFAKDDRVIMLMDNASPGGFIVVRVAPAVTGSRYVLDIRLSMLGAQLVRSFDGTSMHADEEGHALFIVRAGRDRTASVALTVEGTSIYNFHDVTISKLD